MHSQLIWFIIQAIFIFIIKVGYIEYSCSLPYSDYGKSTTWSGHECLPTNLHTSKRLRRHVSKSRDRKGITVRKFPVDVVKDGFDASGAESNNARGCVGGRGGGQLSTCHFRNAAALPVPTSSVMKAAAIKTNYNKCMYFRY